LWVLKAGLKARKAEGYFTLKKNKRQQAKAKSRAILPDLANSCNSKPFYACGATPILPL